MRKKLLSGILFFLVLNLVVKPFWILGIDVQVQNRVGAAEYGLYFAILSFAMISSSAFLLSYSSTKFFILSLLLAIILLAPCRLCRLYNTPGKP